MDQLASEFDAFVRSDPPEPELDQEGSGHEEDGDSNDEEIEEDPNRRIEEEFTSEANLPGESRDQEAQFATVMRKLEDLDMDVPTFAAIWAGKRGTRTYRRRIARIVRAFPHENLVSIKVVRQQLKGLIGEPFFDEYDPQRSMDKVDLKAIDFLIQRRAPAWRSTLHKLLANQRAQRVDPDFVDKRDTLRKKVTTVTALAVHSIASKKSSWWHNALGVFLVTSGVKRRVVEVLNNMGLVSSYHSIQRLMDEIAKAQLQRAREWAQGKSYHIT